LPDGFGVEEGDGEIVDGGFADAKWAVEQLYAALKLEAVYERASEPNLHPGKSARTAEGWVGELHPSLLEGRWGAFELDLDALVAAAPEAVEFEAVSPYPEVRLLAVAPAARGKGIGEALMRECIRRARRSGARGAYGATRRIEW